MGDRAPQAVQELDRDDDARRARRHRRGVLAAPLYAQHVAHTDPFRSNLDGTTVVDGKTGADHAPGDRRARPRRHADRADLGPGALLPRRRQPGPRRRRASPLRRSQLAADRILRRADHLRARDRDRSRRRVLRRVVDGVLSRGLDIVWAFPVYLLAICLSTVLLTQGLALGPFRLGPGSLCCRSGSSASSTCRTSPARSAARCCRCGGGSSSRRRSGWARRTGG